MAGYTVTPPITPGGIVGIGYYIFRFTSECIRGQKWEVTVHANASIAAYGLPISMAGSKVQVNDDLHYINPYVFNGRYSFYSFGAAIGGGYGYSKMAIGGIFTAGHGMYGGFDFYGSLGTGNAEVKNGRVLPCECSK